MTQIIWMFVGLLLAYLVGQVAYEKGRKDKWEEMSKEYICLHKSVIVIKNENKTENQTEKAGKSKKEKSKKNLDNRRKNKYNKKSYSSKK